MLVGQVSVRHRGGAGRANQRGIASRDTLTPMRGARMIAVDLRRHDPRSRTLHRQSSRPHAARRAGRGVRARVARRRRLSARLIDVAHRRDRARSRHRDSGAGRAGAHALLARRVHGALAASRAARRRAAPRARRRAHATNRSRCSPTRYERRSTRRRRSLVEYVQQQRAATDIVPDEHVLIVEQFRDEMGSVRIVLHAPFGGRVNAPWGMALAKRVREWLAEQGAAHATVRRSSCRCRRPTTASCFGCRASRTGCRSSVFAT